jgi:hypothetical protein
VSGDLTIVARNASDRIRDEAAEKYGFDRDAVIVHMTQTHSAPAMEHFFFDSDFENIPDEYEWVRGGDREYTEYVIAEIIKVIGLAVQNLSPVEIGLTWALEGRLAFNRRAIRKDGTIGMPTREWRDKRGNHDFICLEGPMDPQVLVMCFRSPDLKIPAVLLHYSCHPVHVFPKQLISADWPGSWCKGMRELLGTECVPLVLNGCCGNLNPWDPWDPNYANDHERMGQILTQRCQDALEFIEFENSDVLSYRSTHLKIPYR